MTLASRIRPVKVLGLVLSVLLLQAACARDAANGEIDPVGSFAPIEAPVAPLACVQRECPAPFASCPGSRGPCTTNLSSDADHCGACGAACPKPARETHSSFVCSEGQCKMACSGFYADCNNSPADGCETLLYEDHENCGGCGVACKAEDLCWRGACGCPNGLTRCGDDCKNLAADDKNCGACGVPCVAPTDPADPRWTCGPQVTPQNTRWGCTGEGCTLICKGGFENCNKDFCGDGCEIDLLNDRANCGACGNACGNGQTCENGSCLCPPGTTRCDGECVDLKNDPNNCGFCFSRCPGPSTARPGAPSSGGPLCDDGVCKYVCNPGYADCDGSTLNGCETDLRTDQAHCGACGTSCRIAEGQPCVLGQCLTKTCDDPTGPR